MNAGARFAVGIGVFLAMMVNRGVGGEVLAKLSVLVGLVSHHMRSRAMFSRTMGRTCSLRVLSTWKEGAEQPRSTSDKITFLWLQPRRTSVPSLRPMKVSSISTVAPTPPIGE